MLKKYIWPFTPGAKQDLNYQPEEELLAAACSGGALDSPHFMESNSAHRAAPLQAHSRAVLSGVHTLPSAPRVPGMGPVSVAPSGRTKIKQPFIYKAGVWFC